MSGRTTGSRLDEIVERVEELDRPSLIALVQRLARERRLFETVFHTIREGLLLFAVDGRIEYANNAAHGLLGFRRHEVGKVTIWKLLPDLIRTVDLDEEGQLSIEGMLTREFSLSYPEERTVRVYLVPFPAAAEEGTEIEEKYAAIVADVTEDRVSTEERVESERVNSILTLAAGVAHEIGNPLNSLNIHLQLMQRSVDRLKDAKLRDRLGDSLEVCAGEVQRLDGIIAHFLEAIRPRPPDFQDLDLIATLEDVLGTIGEELSNAGITVNLNLSQRPPVVAADRDQLKQVFFNLLKNAREAMPPGGTIEVSARTDDDFVYLVIADNGTGIAEEDLARVFEPYFTTKKSGHGLGMMIVQRILRDHGGSVGIDSRTDLGTVVTLQLPQKDRRIRTLDA